MRRPFDLSAAEARSLYSMVRRRAMKVERDAERDQFVPEPGKTNRSVTNARALRRLQRRLAEFIWEDDPEALLLDSHLLYVPDADPEEG